MLKFYVEKLKKAVLVLQSKVRNPFFLLGLATTIVLISAIFSGKYIIESKTQTNQSASLKISPTPTVSTKVNLTVTPPISKNNSSLKPVLSATPSVTATPTPTNNQSSNNTTQPTRISNPPIIEISFPSEMQSIEFTKPQAEQTFCIVDAPRGGNTEGLQIRYNSNDSWTSYTTHFTLCYEPKDGINRLQVQYKNKYGDEQAIMTRQFYFHRSVTAPTPTLVAGCTSITFTESKSASETVIAVYGAWFLSVRANPEQSSTTFDENQKIIYLHFTMPSGIVSVYTSSYSGAPLCQSYQFGGN